MAWQSIDFQGIASFESALTDQLQQYLSDKQSHLSQMIADSIPSEAEPAHPKLSPAKVQRKLSDGVEIFARKVNQASVNPTLNEKQWQYTVDKINSSIWEYAELLQGMAVELFQQLDQIGIDQWKPEVLKVVDSIKEILLHHIDDLKWAIKRLESQLRDYKTATGEQCRCSKWLSFIQPLWKSAIDPAIVKNLDKSQKFLNFRHQNFVHRYDQYNELNTAIEKKMVKFHSYKVLENLEPDEQKNFKCLYRLLKLWKANKQARALPDRELVRVVRFAITPEKASAIFRNYYHHLERQLFAQSRLIKESNEASPSAEDLEAALNSQRFELHTLGATISAHRSFLLESDPNPYVRTRGGFSEWIVGHEPPQTKSLIEQEYDVEKLDALYLRFLESLKPNPEDTPYAHQKIYRQIEAVLHDMGQPLASSGLMYLRGQQFVEHLNQLGELSTKDAEVVKQITPLLSRAMRADWKYHVLHEMPLFHQLYAVHMQILPSSTDRQHLNRLRHFKRLLQQLQQWVKDKSTLSHMNEIDLDINDIKGYLQDFLAQLQRVSGDASLFNKKNGESIIATTAQQLLEYRYLFGHFFHQLRQTDVEEKLLRSQFLFVDHYFETVENKLIDMRDALATLD